MTITALCVGGPKDGMLVSVAHGSRFMTPIEESEMPLRPDVQTDPTRSTGGNAEYRLETVTTDGGVLRFWVLEQLSAHAAIERLLANYRP